MLYAYEGRGEILVLIFIFAVYHALASQAPLSVGTGPLTG